MLYRTGRAFRVFVQGAERLTREEEVRGRLP
jgi:hypothetical protein